MKHQGLQNWAVKRLQKICPGGHDIEHTVQNMDKLSDSESCVPVYPTCVESLSDDVVCFLSYTLVPNSQE